MFMLDNKPLPLDTAFTHNEVQYPANWLRLATQEERAALGITEVTDEIPYDDRFYWGADNPKDLDQLKSQWIAQVKQTAGSLLAQTDWMVIRKAERDIAIPLDVATKRLAVLTEANRLETAIRECADVPALIAVVTAQQWATETV